MTKPILFGSTAIALVAFAAPVSAQTAPAPQQGASASAEEAGDAPEIIVTGNRRLSRSPQDAKQKSLAIVDSVGALEIQKLTDTTVADALTKLPGVNPWRGFQTSKAWYVNVRGLDANYNSVDLDGGMFFDSSRNDRAIYMDTVPANAINELVVTKTVTPDMDANSIGGHISIRTLRSFDLNGAPVTKLAASANFYDQHGAARGFGPGFTADAVIKRTFGPNGDFGFVLAASAHDDHTSEIYHNIGGYVRPNGIDVPTGSVQNGNFDNHDYGQSLMAKIEARSSDSFYGFANVTYFNEQIRQDNYYGGIAINPTFVTNASEGSGNFTNGTAQAFAREYDLSRKLLTGTVGAEFKVTDVSKLSLVGSLESSHHNEDVRVGSTFAFNNLAGQYNIGQEGGRFTLTPVPAGLNDPALWTGNPASPAQATHLPMQDKVYTLRADYNHNNFDFSRGLGFAFGGAFRRLDRNFVQTVDRYTLAAGTPYQLASFINSAAPNQFDANGPVFVDPDKYWNYITANGIRTTTPAPTSSYHLFEDVLAGYGALYFTADNFRAIAGFRYESTHVDNTTANVLNSVTTPFRFKRKYNNFLPNVQLTYDIVPSLRVKAAFTETIARPRFQQFAQSQTINNFSSTNVTVFGSNPDLIARRSRNYDISIESYHSGGFVSLGFFKKNIDHEVYNLLTTTSDPATGAVTQTSIPQNAGSSKVSGLEAQLEWHDFTSVAPWLEGFGFRANYTRLWGKLGVVNADRTTRTINALSQQPSYEANVILTYDHGPLSASLNWSGRGRSFTGTVGAVAAGDVWIAPYSSVNARLGYKVVDGVEVFVSGRNLTDSTWRETSGIDSNQTQVAIKNGRTFLVGAQVRF